MHWDPLYLVLGLTILFALVFSMTNGWNDAANAIATVVSTRGMKPWQAIAMGATMNLVGAFVSGKVANTVGADITNTQLTPTTYLAAVMVAPLWAALCTLRGLPISCGHSLFGGLIGAVLASAGWEALKGGVGFYKIVFGVFISPVMGFVLGYGFMLGLSWLFRRARPKTATAIFNKLHVLSAGAMALAHGAGDAQPPMGIIAGALVAGKFLEKHGDGTLPLVWWIKLSCALAMTLGTALGGWAVMKTLGSGLSKLTPHQGFAASGAASITILANILGAGIPTSTTHSITGAIAGSGATSGLRSVKWGVGGKILSAWVFTFPACIAGGAILYKLLRLVGL